jgi:hypothetical protein
VEDDMFEHPDHAKEILLRQLRAAVGARIADDTDPETVNAELTERLRRLRWMRPTGTPVPPDRQLGGDVPGETEHRPEEPGAALGIAR